MKRRAEESPADREQDADIHPARKRRLEYSEADKQLAQLYNDLSDEVKSTRIKAAAGLVRALKDAESTRLEEAITRLVKGLCSSRKASRSGFFVALIEVLSLIKRHDHSPSASPDLSPRSLISKIESLTQPDGASNNRVSETCIATLLIVLIHVPGETRLSSWEMCSVQSSHPE